MLRLIATVDLSHDSERLAYDVDRADRAKLADLSDLPNGARVRVTIGSRVWPSTAAVVALREHQDRLHLQIEGDARALANWHAEIVAGVVA